MSRLGKDGVLFLGLVLLVSIWHLMLVCEHLALLDGHSTVSVDVVVEVEVYNAMA